MHSSTELAHVARLRRESLTTGQVHHTFHYQSLQQSRLWLDVFRKHSPVVQDGATFDLYQQLAETVAAQKIAPRLHVISLGCGDGRKDHQLVRALQEQGTEVVWSPQDVSPSLVSESLRPVDLPALSALYPMVGDLAAMTDLKTLLDTFAVDAPRLFTFYGLVPNFEPSFLRTFWADLLRPQDHLLVSANLAPAADESRGCYFTATESILPQYNNLETKRWLTAVLQDWGVSDKLGNYRMRLEAREELLRFVAVMDWLASEEFPWEGETLRVRAGENLRLFFSVRYTPARFLQLAQDAGLQPQSEIVSPSREEGVWWLTPAVVN